MTAARALDLLTDALAAARLVRLVTLDTFPPAEALRQRAYTATLHRHGPGWAEGWGCPWCAGVWCAAAVTVARALAPGPWGHAARALAVAQVAGILTRD